MSDHAATLGLLVLLTSGQQTTPPVNNRHAGLVLMTHTDIVEKMQYRSGSQVIESCRGQSGCAIIAFTWVLH